MGVEKMSVSLELDLGAAVRESAGQTGTSVSAWLADAARDRLRNEALHEAVVAWEDEFGPLTDDELAAAGRVLDAAANPGVARTQAS